MEQIIPLTAYQVRSLKPTSPRGVPAVARLAANAAQLFLRVPLDKIPLDAVITDARVRLYADRAVAGSKDVDVRPVTSEWKARIIWDKRPTVGAQLDTVTVAGPVANSEWELNVTSWAAAATRPRHGLRLSTDATQFFLHGSAAAVNQPVLVVNYYVPTDQPGGLVPNGGAVSVPVPILDYVGDPDMTQQKIEFSLDGITVSSATAWLPATSARFTDSMAPGVQPVLADGGAGIYWRAYTDGPSGPSAPSDWAFYSYNSLPDVAFTSPGATTPDGSPVAQWTVSNGVQSAYKITLNEGSTVIDKHDWDDSDTDRDWTPTAGVKVPDGIGKFILEVEDDVKPRVSAANAPTTRKVPHTFTTTLAGTTPAIDSINFEFDDPIVTITGARAAGIPDEIALVRDDKIVPLWDEEGNSYKDWAPGLAFFDTSTTFRLPDYTADPRHAHEWSVRTRGNGTDVSLKGPTVVQMLRTPTVWLVDPRTGQKVEVIGDSGPVIDQSTEEAAILHLPINSGVHTEAKRRRIARTTRSGTMQGVVLAEQEDILEEWAESDASLKYRLVFGKVNWPVILGDYSPSDVFYPYPQGPDRILIELSWWQRLKDL